MSKYKDTGEKIFIADKETQDAIKEELDRIYNNVVDPNPVYGFIEHNATLAPDQRIEYIGANKNYTPISVTLTGEGGYSLNSWANFPWLLSNRPYMVRMDGTPDYELSATDYTKKADGTTPSDVADEKYKGAGAFSWCQKIYKREYMSGSDRVVMFSMTRREGFEPIGFVDDDGTELEGVWIPMFYGAVTDSASETEGMPEENKGAMRSLSGMQPQNLVATDAQKTAIEKVGDRARFFGGAVVHTIVDLEIMFAKTTDLQGAYGKGNCDGYDSGDTTNHGILKNAVVNGGQFFGTSDGKKLNKIFHSIALGSYQIWLRDPYMMNINGRLKVAKGYTYEANATGYLDTGIQFEEYAGGYDGSNNKCVYPAYYQTVPGFGNLPAGKMDGGSTSTGGCDGIWTHKPSVTITAVSLRFGCCNDGLACGGRYLAFAFPAAAAPWYCGAALLLLPPAGTAA